MMPATFSKILIPIDFSVNTESAIYKAISLIEAEGCTFHLLHVVKPGKSAATKFSLWDAEKKLMQWKATLEERYPALKVDSHILRGNSVQRVVIQFARLIDADLIIIGKQQGRRPWWVLRHISPDTIAKKSTCPVLTVKPGSTDIRTRIIVIPVGNFIPKRKLALGILLAKKYRAQIHLLAIQSNVLVEQQNRQQVFLASYQELKEKVSRPIQCSSAVRYNTAKAALAYAKSVKADMILVNPETESGHAVCLTGFRHLSEMLERNSRIQIMDVLPYAH
jgi:nucleotide-binding universal stress UspA family protein